MKTYTLYLVKEDVANFEDVFTEKALERITRSTATISHRVDPKASAYIFQNPKQQPSWLSDIKSSFSGIPTVENMTSSAVVVFEKAGRIFAIPFSHGWHYIDDTKIEADFGIRVAINSLNDQKIKRIDSNHLAEAIKAVSQSVFQRDIRAFEIDEALDLVQRITGRTDKDTFADTLSGANSLRITREMQLADMFELAEEALIRFNDNSYKSTNFHIIDKIRPVLDKLLCAKLDAEAVEIIRDGRDNLELSMPGWSEHDIVYYGFYGPGLKGRYPDLLMAHYRNALGSTGIKSLTMEAIISRHGIVAEFADDSSSTRRWSIKKALIGSVVSDPT